jgi:hypothetical protein
VTVEPPIKAETSPEHLHPRATLHLARGQDHSLRLARGRLSPVRLARASLMQIRQGRSKTSRGQARLMSVPNRAVAAEHSGG